MTLSSFNSADYNGWIFDLDNTLYAADSGLFSQVSQRMTDFLMAHFGFDRAAATALRRDLFQRYGTTASGLIREYNMDISSFLSYVHDIDLSSLSKDSELDAVLAGLAGDKVIFTNGTRDHAQRILAALGIEHHFSYYYDIIEADYRSKPEPAIYDDMLAKTGLDASSCVMVEDMAVNLPPASRLGIATVWLSGNNAALSSLDYIDFIARDLKDFFRNIDGAQKC